MLLLFSSRVIFFPPCCLFGTQEYMGLILKVRDFGFGALQLSFFYSIHNGFYIALRSKLFFDMELS